MRNNDLVSIIIPLYNSEKYISECVRSCREQSHQNLEIIIIDDGSSDNSLAVARELAKHDMRIVVAHQKNMGVSSARNVGLDIAKGEYICFVDADDCLEKVFVEKYLSIMLQNGSDFLFCINTFDEKKKKDGYKIVSSFEAEKMLLSMKIKNGCWNKMYRRDLLGKIRFREDLFYGEGLHFIINVASHAKKIVMDDGGLYHYRAVNPKSATRIFDEGKMANGEKSLRVIKRMLVDGDVLGVWNQHYCIFCMNAIYEKLSVDFSADVDIWRKRYNTAYGKASRFGLTVKQRIRMLITRISPRIIASFSKIKRF